MRHLTSDTPGLPLNLSVDEAAAALGISSRTVRTLIARKELPVVRIGIRRVLLPWAALAAWNRDHSTELPS